MESNKGFFRGSDGQWMDVKNLRPKNESSTSKLFPLASGCCWCKNPAPVEDDTLPPIIMEVKNGSVWKVTRICWTHVLTSLIMGGRVTFHTPWVTTWFFFHSIVFGDSPRKRKHKKETFVFFPIAADVLYNAYPLRGSEWQCRSVTHISGTQCIFSSYIHLYINGLGIHMDMWIGGGGDWDGENSLSL